MTTAYDLMVAPNGARLTKADHPALPMTAIEIANTAVACAAAGATAIHTHVRDDAGRHSLDPQRYAQTIETIRARSDIRIQISTEAAGMFDVAMQRTCLANTTAQDASVSIREMARDPDGMVDTYNSAVKSGISIQHILYDSSDVALLFDAQDRGDVPACANRAICVLGRYAAGQRSTPSDLKPFLSAMKHRPLDWAVCAFGPEEQACLLAALNEGGNVRIGFENNRLAPNGTPFPDNSTSVAAFVAAADRHGFYPQQVAS